MYFCEKYDKALRNMIISIVLIVDVN